jgi:hypothetical protein
LVLDIQLSNFSRFRNETSGKKKPKDKRAWVTRDGSYKGKVLFAF